MKKPDWHGPIIMRFNFGSPSDYFKRRAENGSIEQTKDIFAIRKAASLQK